MLFGRVGCGIDQAPLSETIYHASVMEDGAGRARFHRPPLRFQETNREGALPVRETEHSSGPQACKYPFHIQGSPSLY